MLKDLFVSVMAAAIWQGLWENRSRFARATCKGLYLASALLFFAAQWIEQKEGLLLLS